MSLILYAHPLSAFCWKALIALYETKLPFTFELVDFGDSGSRERFLAMWPIGKFPVLRDVARDLMVPEASLIVEYVDQLAGGHGLVPADPDQAREVRLWDRFHDLYVAQPMQKAITDGLRPEGQRDLLGVEQAEAQIRTAYAVAEAAMARRTWAAGERFTMADCAAAPALYYADWVIPLGAQHPALAAYLARLKARPSFARALAEAEPYLHMVPRARTAVPA
jgi:glutathione S-transferase